MIVRGRLISGWQPYFRWFDFWVGVFVKRPGPERRWLPDLLDDDWIYGYRDPIKVFVQPLPMVGVRFLISSEPVRVKRTALDELRAVVIPS